ncbi:hypothetical protein ABZ876_23640 [Streptomyces sp. NPDC046931]|uniref:hypothetical protein n=1 Tax=Streptomyces sp. NPDC046931 TaxID=3154806 RepID=UPI0033C1123F
MRMHKVNTAVTLSAVVLLAAAMGTASAAPTAGHTPQRGSAHPVIVDCVWHAQVRPAEFMIACGDGNSILSSLRWSHWDQGSATASGVNVVNDCTPYCAAGTFHSYPVTVRLDHPQSWKKNPRVQHYTRMSLVYTDARPDGYDRVVTYPLWN